MVVPKVIATPSKSYVAINSYKSDRSLSTSLCDLGRVSNIAAVVTLPKTLNFANRNNVAQSARKLPYKKRPISEVSDFSNPISTHANTTTEISLKSTLVPHKKRRYTLESQSSTSTLESHSSISALATQPTFKSNPHRNGVSNPQVKKVKFNSTESLDMIAANNINSNSYPQSNKSDGSTRLPFPHSTIQKLFLQPVQRRLQETATSSLVHRNQHDRLHGSNSSQQSNQQNVQLSSELQQLPTHNSLSKKLLQQNQVMTSQQTLQLPAARTEKLPTHHSISMQPQQQIQQTSSQQTLQLPTTIMEQIPTHNLLSMQLQQQNQQLRSENMQLQKQLSLFRQLIKNPQRLNQVLTRLEQRVQ